MSKSSLAITIEYSHFYYQCFKSSSIIKPSETKVVLSEYSYEDKEKGAFIFKSLIND